MCWVLKMGFSEPCFYLEDKYGVMCADNDQ